LILEEENVGTEIHTSVFMSMIFQKALPADESNQFAMRICSTISFSDLWAYMEIYQKQNEASAGITLIRLTKNIKSQSILKHINRTKMARIRTTTKRP